MSAVSPISFRLLRWSRLAYSVVVVVVGLTVAHAQLVRVTPALGSVPSEPLRSLYKMEPALGSLTFSQPLAIASPPGETGRIFVVEKTGQIQVVDLARLTKKTFLDVRDLPGVGDLFTDESECGLLGLAFHPDYASNRRFFITYSMRIPSTYRQRIARVQASASDPDRADVASQVVLINQIDLNNNHNGGDLHFGPNGYLYVALGDGGGADDSFDNARWIDRDFHAGLMRLDVDRINVGRPGGSREPNPHPAIVPNPSDGNRAYYAIPPDNPLLDTSIAGTLGPLGAGSYPSGGPIDASKLRTEFYAYGLRNPWRFSFDVPTGRLFLGDVGQSRREEINLVTRGANLGWPYREATLPGPNSRQPTPANPPSPRVEPIHDYPRTVGQSVTGGVVYRGSRLTELTGEYVFADFYRSVFALREVAGIWQRRVLTQDAFYTAGIGVDPRDGDLLFADIYGGSIQRLARNGSAGGELPATLSATGLFSDLAELSPTAGVVPYDVNHPFWSDHARKRRWFAVPAAPAAINFSVEGSWGFPAGTVWVKHFDLDATRGDAATARRIETRVLVKNADGLHGFTYRWREDQTDADLVPEIGAEADYAVKADGLDRTIRWSFPTRAQCLSCHTPEAGHVLGFDTRQLNRHRIHGAVEDNQINHLAAAGFFSTFTRPTAAVVAAAPAHAALEDESQSLEHRLRSYLAVNCLSCHGQGSFAGDFHVAPFASTEATGLRSAAAVRSGGGATSRLLVPGDAANSYLLKRILGDGVPRMPPLASNETDPGAESLLRAYIAELPTKPLFDEWQLRHFGEGVAAHEAETDPDGDRADNRLEYLANTSPVVPGADPLAFSLTPAGGETVLRFRHPAGRSVVMETSPNGTTWTRWLPPEGDSIGYPAIATDRELRVPGDPATTRIRVRILER